MSEEITGRSSRSLEDNLTPYRHPEDTEQGWELMSGIEKRDTSKIEKEPIRHSFSEDQSFQDPILWSEGTQSLNLSTLLPSELSKSGSFDIRGDIWASTFGKLLEALPIPAFLVDRNSIVTVGNQAFRRLSSEWARRKRIYFADLFLNSIEGEQATGNFREVFETRNPKSFRGILRVGNGKLWARLSLRSVRIVDVRLVLVLVEDLTHERKLLDMHRSYEQDLKKQVKKRTDELERTARQLKIEMRERQRAQEMLVQSERLRAVGEMSAGVAHNFKNFLHILRLSTESALEHAKRCHASEAVKGLERIAETAEHAAETINRLRDFAHLTCDQAAPKETVFDSTEMLRKAIDLTMPFWRTSPQQLGRTIELRTRLLEGCWIRGNETEILEVLVNLIKNAAEAMPDGGVIKLESTVIHKNVVFTIQDPGVGISEDNMRKLFTPFFTTKTGTGTGLGLATSRGIVHRHGGSIVAHSKDGEGTTFVVTLPLAASKPSRVAPSFSTSRGPQLRILAVDDSESNLIVLKAGLEEYHHKVYTATSGHEALRIFADDNLELILCDIAMPGMNGWEVGRRIKRLCEEKRLRKIPFILLTGWGKLASADEKMIESGVDAVVEKPIALDRLQQIVCRIARERSERKK